MGVFNTDLLAKLNTGVSRHWCPSWRVQSYDSTYREWQWSTPDVDLMKEAGTTEYHSEEVGKYLANYCDEKSKSWGRSYRVVLCPDGLEDANHTPSDCIYYIT